MEFDELKDAVEHAIGEVQCKYNESLGIQDASNANAELFHELDRVIMTVSDYIYRIAESAQNPISTHYAEADDMTFIMQDKFVNGHIVSQEVVGWYFGKPDANLTREYFMKLKAEYTKDDYNYLRGAER